ncbi:hypothetical protein F5Y02DRAFT_379289 [Annulohypoxylon stygium]|nr:hypothetical protein F5Y02DRAFT_379289 [Annulohypoxylon stygium]
MPMSPTSLLCLTGACAMENATAQIIGFSPASDASGDVRTGRCVVANASDRSPHRRPARCPMISRRRPGAMINRHVIQNTVDSGCVFISDIRHSMLT